MAPSSFLLAVPVGPRGPRRLPDRRRPTMAGPIGSVWLSYGGGARKGTEYPWSGPTTLTRIWPPATRGPCSWSMTPARFTFDGTRTPTWGSYRVRTAFGRLPPSQSPRMCCRRHPGGNPGSMAWSGGVPEMALMDPGAPGFRPSMRPGDTAKSLGVASWRMVLV